MLKLLESNRGRILIGDDVGLGKTIEAGYILTELEAGRREFRVVMDIPAGRWVGEQIGAGEAAKIMTGAPLPPGVDTVVQVEHTAQHGDALVVREPVRPGAAQGLLADGLRPVGVSSFGVRRRRLRHRRERPCLHGRPTIAFRWR